MLSAPLENPKEISNSSRSPIYVEEQSSIQYMLWKPTLHRYLLERCEPQIIMTEKATLSTHPKIADIIFIRISISGVNENMIYTGLYITSEVCDIL